MKLLIIGQSVEDHISEAGRTTIKPGGIFYSAAALANFAGPEDELYLCTSVQNGKEALFDEVYRKINRAFLQNTTAIPVVHLTIHPDKEREELYENITTALDLNGVKFEEIDAVYLNMITGFDIELEKLEELRNKYPKLIYLDIHTLSRGYDANGKRNFRKIPDADRWIRSTDIIQVNEHELFTLSDKTDKYEIIKYVLHSGPGQLILTMGDKGVRVYFMEKGEVKSIFLSAIKINTLNKVGCGDVFGAVYFYYYVKSKNILEALKLANIAGGLTATYNRISDFDKLKNDVLSRYN
jgi:sugar/nucleoside kinase (ribokinase family)